MDYCYAKAEESMTARKTTEMKKILSPSIMCADIGRLREEIALLDAAGADMFHLDITDGEFVPNFALSWCDFRAIRSTTNKPMDVHLMTRNPGIHLSYAYKNKANIAYVHYESGNAANYLEDIKKNGLEAGLAINPDTKLSEFYPLLFLIDRLLVMRVHPGFAASPAVPKVERKLYQLTKLQNRKFKIVLDGAVSPEVIAKWSQKGVDEFVLGTASGMFGAKRDGRTYGEIVENLRACTQDGMLDFSTWKKTA